MLPLLIPSAILLISLYVLVRGADLFIEGAKQVGEALGMSRFAIGVLIAGFGTSLPEFSSAIAATIHGTPEIVLPTAIGSNITNILFIVGVLATMSGKIIIKRDLVKAELPVFFIATAEFFLVVWDGTIDLVEALLLVGTFGAYLWYLYSEAGQEDSIELTQKGHRPQLEVRSVVFIVLGLVAVLFGAGYTVDMVVKIATILTIPIGLVAITAIAMGTSLPELFVSIQAVKAGEAELAIGNIFGSNAFNLLVGVGVPALVTTLHADMVVTTIGLPILLVSSGILFVSGLAKQIMRWQGLMLLIFFAFFLVQLAEFCVSCVVK